MILLIGEVFIMAKKKAKKAKKPVKKRKVKSEKLERIEDTRPMQGNFAFK